MYGAVMSGGFGKLLSPYARAYAQYTLQRYRHYSITGLSVAVTL